LQETGEVGWHYHLRGLLVTLGTHAAIVMYVQIKKRQIMPVK
jgi:hypothetical protein